MALAAAVAVCTAAAGWLVLRGLRERHEVVVLRDDAGAAEQLLLEREQAAPAGVSGLENGRGAAALVREPISEADAQILFRIDPKYLVYDPFTYYRFRSGIDERFPFAEHAGGSYRQHTSAEGWVEDFEHLPEQRDFFVVVAGDSHTQGLCDPGETFANRLEALLRERHPGKAIEVLNTGATGYSFYNYLGALEKLLPEKPQAFVVAFYSGNDFLDMVRPWHFFHHTSPPKRRSDYQKKLDRGASLSSGAFAQALNQMLFFQYHPDQVDIALEGAAQACGEIQRICKERGIELCFVHIPLGFDPRGPISPVFETAKEELGLTGADLEQDDRLADKLIAVLRGRGVEVVDLREQFAPQREPFYWSELHINVRGHQKIAELLLPRAESWMAHQ